MGWDQSMWDSDQIGLFQKLVLLSKGGHSQWLTYPSQVCFACRKSRLLSLVASLGKAKEDPENLESCQCRPYWEKWSMGPHLGIKQLPVYQLKQCKGTSGHKNLLLQVRSQVYLASCSSPGLTLPFWRGWQGLNLGPLSHNAEALLMTQSHSNVPATQAFAKNWKKA